MKILLIGLLAFSGWSSLSTYLYVCKIRGLCDTPITMNRGAAIITEGVKPGDSENKAYRNLQAEVPEILVIYFAFDKSYFNSTNATDRYFKVTNEYLNQNSEAKLSIKGHADAVGSKSYNQALGYRRAESMKHYFENMGIIENKIIIESKGEIDPVDNNNTDAGRANNRRSVITIKK